MNTIYLSIYLFSFLWVISDEMCPIKDSYIEGLNPNAAIFAGGANRDDQIIGQ